MKVWLDDVRPAPRGWRRARWPEQVIQLLQGGKVTELSLDYDLGDLSDRRNGEVVIKWLEEQVALHGFVPPRRIKIHSGNISAAPRMEAGVRSIYRFAQRNLGQERNPSSTHSVNDDPTIVMERVGKEENSE